MSSFFTTHEILAVFILIPTVLSLNDIHLSNLSLKTVQSLLNILSKYEKDVKYVIIEPNNQKATKKHENPIENRNNFFSGRLLDYMTDKRFVKPGRHILTKRLLPHGFPASKLEYDSKYNTYYRPLVRVHKRKILPKIETILNLNRNSDAMDKYGIDFYDYYDNDENVLKFAIEKPSENLKHFKVTEAGKNLNVDEELLQPFAVNFKENYESLDDISTQLILLENIQKLLRKIRSRSSKIKYYKDITKQLDNIINLRSQKSGEDDPMAPGKLVLEDEDNERGPSKPKKWITHYAPWNFWTYKKKIYQDACPEGQVKIANLCVWVPPH